MAWIRCRPDAVKDTVQVATSLASGTVLHSVADPSWKATVPVALGATVAVRVTGWPIRLGFSDEVSEVVVRTEKIYVKRPIPVPVPPGVVTITSTRPVACAGVTAVMVVALMTVTPVAAPPPNVTLVALVKLVPVMVTAVPPSVDPLLGLTPVTVGGAP
jgi:hypothetical protein